MGFNSGFKGLIFENPQSDFLSAGTVDKRKNFKFLNI